MEADEELSGLVFQLDSIFGANVGFEFVPKQVFEEQGDEDVQWSFMIDLLFFRIIITKY